jgi:hypothetical protein
MDNDKKYKISHELRCAAIAAILETAGRFARHEYDLDSRQQITQIAADYAQVIESASSAYMVDGIFPNAFSNNNQILSAAGE